MDQDIGRAAGPEPIPPWVIRAFIWTPPITMVPLTLTAVAWSTLAWGEPLPTLGALAGWLTIVIVVALPIAYFCMGIVGSIVFRFLSRKSRFDLLPTVAFGALCGLLAPLPFFGLWLVGFWLVGLLSGAAGGGVFWWLARRFQPAAV